MAKLAMSFTVALLCVTRIASAWQQGNVNLGSWSGIIINGGCTVDEAFAESDKCFQRHAGARLSLYDDTTRQIYDLDAQDQAARYFGDSVTVEGTLQANTIQVAEIKKLTSIGLAVGQKAPVFSARDQFGREQNLETLKGPKGTVLLFFRSADW
jgi:hypothetical protein